MKNELSELKCPCGSGNDYNNCCGKFHNTKSFPETAEELMRSRYSAFSKGLVDYLTITFHPDVRTKPDNRLSQAQVEQSTWLKLEIIKTSHGKKSDKTGKVEFRAYYINDTKVSIHHELSRFKKHNGIWYYIDGIIFKY
ncbi:MAG TPA: YchJ family metal-binding protein [Victivallales bacterium]|nr:YchJ family metal-binding protein [Victivallales bacterium]